jgi:hypothetical protein
MKMLITTVRTFPKEERMQYLRNLIFVNRKLGLEQLADLLEGLKDSNRVELVNDQVTTIYEFVDEQ